MNKNEHIHWILLHFELMEYLVETLIKSGDILPLF